MTINFSNVKNDFIQLFILLRLKEFLWHNCCCSSHSITKKKKKEAFSILSFFFLKDSLKQNFSERLMQLWRR